MKRAKDPKVRKGIAIDHITENTDGNDPDITKVPFTNLSKHM